MTPERWQQIDRLLEQALELEPDRRSAFLDEACHGDSALRLEVESLLSAHGKAEGFTEVGPMGKLARRTGVEEPELLTGRQIGHYQILARLGEGGMGIVYKARDQHLDRFVAIKVLPPELVADSDRKRRFVQEAKAASALNHPNIITVHDIASDNGTDFIVMEYVQGKTLGQLIPCRGLKLNEVLKHAIQIADALAKAHTAGIIHRDLKPGNIMVGEGGLVKVLDFGLAKLTERSQVGEEELTGTMPAWTDEGTILGTAAYMSPEQAVGKSVDARSDIFSFGSVLYEMVTGQRAFQGDSKMSTLAAVLKQEPKPASEIARSLPLELERIISRCLRKDPSRRFQHMDDVKVFLQEAMEKAAYGEPKEMVESDRRRTRHLTVSGGLLLCLAALLVAAWVWRSFRKSDELPMTAIPLTTYPGHERFPTFSPDGNQVAFCWNGEKEDNFDIYVKQIGTDDRPLRLTTDRAQDSGPAWSPDGRWIAFLRDLGEGRSAVLRVPPIGGPERKLGEVNKPGFGGGFPVTWSGWGFPLTWSSNGESLVVVDRESDSEPYGLFVLSVESGEKRRLTSPPASASGDRGPSFSPDGGTIGFIRTVEGYQAGDLYLLPVGEGIRAIAEPKRLTSGRWFVESACWAPEGRDIIFSSVGPGAGGLWRVAASGSGQPQQLVVGENGRNLSISREKRRLAYSRAVSDVDIWRVEVSPGKTKSERFISSTRLESNPQFSPDGKRIAFSSDRSGSVEIWVCNSDRSSAVQLTSFGRQETASPRWSPDSRWVSFDSNVEGQWEVYLVDSNGGKPRRLTSHPAADSNPSWSRNGKWIYFGSNRSGRYEVWKMPAFGGEGGVKQVTQNGGFLPLESFDGKFVYYTKDYAARSIWKVPSQGGEEAELLAPIFPRNFDVAKDGIYFISEPDSSKNHSIRFFSFATGAIKSIASIENPTGFYITISPDGRWILYPKLNSVGSDLMLVENFR